jgi:hypothetical protein
MPKPVFPLDTTTVPTKTSFRIWMDGLRKLTGNHPQWPWLLHSMLLEEYCRQRQFDFNYGGSEVFIDRDEHDPTTAKSPEKRAVRRLFHLCRKQSEGRFTINEKPYWLLGYEWPNQGRNRGRRADLVGMTMDGGLVVFECKYGTNHDSPFTAILEGLDYLACLTATANFHRIQDGFAQWIKKPGQIVPDGFKRCRPDAAAKPEIILLAPDTYYDKYDRSQRGHGWREFASVCNSGSDTLLIGFAASDFITPSGTWIAP